MSWHLTYIKKASNDLRRLDGNQKRAVLKAILRVSQNPLPTSEGGYGKPLGNRAGTRLASLLKIKLKDQGLRVVYQLIRVQQEMRIIIISIRADEQVYKEAQARMDKLKECSILHKSASSAHGM